MPWASFFLFKCHSSGTERRCQASESAGHCGPISYVVTIGKATAVVIHPRRIGAADRIIRGVFVKERPSGLAEWILADKSAGSGAVIPRPVIVETWVDRHSARKLERIGAGRCGFPKRLVGKRRYELSVLIHCCLGAADCVAELIFHLATCMGHCKILINYPTGEYRYAVSVAPGDICHVREIVQNEALCQIESRARVALLDEVAQEIVQEPCILPGGCGN